MKTLFSPMLTQGRCSNLFLGDKGKKAKYKNIGQRTGSKMIKF